MTTDLYWQLIGEKNLDFSASGERTFTLPLRHWFPTAEMLEGNRWRVLIDFARERLGTVQIRVQHGRGPVARLSRGSISSFRQRSFEGKWRRLLKVLPNRGIEARHFCGASMQETLLPPLFEDRSLLVEKPTSSKLIYYLVFAQPDGGGVYARRILNLANDSAYHDLLFADPPAEGVDVAVEVMDAALKFYQQIGVRRILMTAGLSAGGRLWPKFGFRPIDLRQWRRCARGVRATLASLDAATQSRWRQTVNEILAESDPRHIWELSELNARVASREGHKLGNVLLTGTRWKGILDLDDVASDARLRAHLARKDPR